MSNRRRDKPSANVFNESNPAPSTPPENNSLQAVTNRGYGGPDLVFSADKRIKINNLPIDSIYPDPQQARRAIPSQLREVWSGNPHELADFLNVWITQTRIDIEAFFNESEDYERPTKPDAVEAALLALLETALSIKRDGLINPITVVRHQEGYVIETGERRWLSYHLLRLIDAKAEKWETIPARIENQMDVWRQASENNARENLNAIARARQLALLIMDVYGRENFQPLTSFEHEQDFYAQVEDGRTYQIPAGRSDDLVNALGLSDVGQLRQYRMLLRMPKEHWTYADDNNMTEGELREILKQGWSVTEVTVEKEKRQKLKTWERRVKSFYDILEPRHWRKLSAKDKKEVYRETQVLLRKMEELGLD